MFYILVGFLLWLIYHFVTRNNGYWKKRQVVSPEAVPFFGNFSDYILGKKYVGDIYKDIYNSFPNEKVVGFYRMMTPTLLVRDPEIIKNILLQDFEVFPDRGVYFSKAKLGDNLFHADAETWKLLKNRFTNIFTPGKLKSAVTILEDVSERSLEYLENYHLDNMEVEIYSFARNYAVATTMACMFDLHHNNFDDISDIAKRMDDLIFSNNYRNQLEFTVPGTLTKLNLSMYPRKAQDFFGQIAKILSEKKGKIKKDFVDVISSLIKEKEMEFRDINDNRKVLKISNDLIAGQAFIFYTAGYVNSAVTITMLLYQLALNANVQEKLIANIDQMIEKFNGNVTYESVAEMDYLDQVFDETLRMYTPTASIPRQAFKDYLIPGTDIVIEKNMTVIISPDALHRDEKHFPEANRFYPERFSPENLKTRHPYAHIPFGAGPRSCIGRRFGRLQTCVCIAKFLSKYRVEPTQNTTYPDIKYEPSRGIASPRGGVQLKLIPRNKSNTNLGEP